MQTGSVFELSTKVVSKVVMNGNGKDCVTRSVFDVKAVKNPEYCSGSDKGTRLGPASELR